ncbi:RHS repeat-associated core domain-containing protein [Pseudomonas sp. R5(2019)]|uniref:RHS repeat-associated core domain-containing protein n=1 Tax=Pseudomonas sp. R5(2019) TaxID=2697566 RepID=UPI001412869E|nr:RHS repeat-associated core domain-containing protein [Pseudomonas sp. R5(2019)]NBA96706.1 hypothetical protein [Pseudomonas sp. R5(2019)]
MEHSPVLISSSNGFFATDAFGSVLRLRGEIQKSRFAYTAYGYRSSKNLGSTPLAFNAQLCEFGTGLYLLGHGRRGFNSVLMRFNSPDPYSPFSRGGLNSYAYCSGDPVNNIDPSGNVKLFGRTKSPNWIYPNINKAQKAFKKHLNATALNAGDFKLDRSKNKVTIEPEISNYHELRKFPYRHNSPPSGLPRGHNKSLIEKLAQIETLERQGGIDSAQSKSKDAILKQLNDFGVRFVPDRVEIDASSREPYYHTHPLSNSVKTTVSEIREFTSANGTYRAARTVSTSTSFNRSGA